MWWPPRVGEPLPRGAEAVGVYDKLARYSLAIGHRDGGPKAYRFRKVLGITLVDIDHLVTDIAAGVLTEPVTRVRPKPDGTVGCGVLVPVRGVDIHERRVVLVTTGWKLRYVGDRPRLVTAYIGDR
jgi:hypothetical protein